ncbi:hypothetical protein QOZ84_09645 [Romboutsia sedimentorum]|uniref:Uncharacterized protein n=1 Tax=Romboutsia sedimentorum TaxID=1368474 RepID=A0ABT7EAU6_9FIRM|nr:hypothetical protein [Romboutsia sedimentorum]MDK2563812.1 hypothetical protein [Romboutsia sedimentorum]
MDNKNTKKIKTKCSKSKSTTNKCTKNIDKNNSSKCSTNKQLDLGLKNISYADYVLLASVAAYAISEDLNDSDLDLLIVFFSMMSSDLALVRTKRGIRQREQAKNNMSNTGNAAVDSSIVTADETLVSDLPRSVKVKKKCVKIKKKK